MNSFDHLLEALDTKGEWVHRIEDERTIEVMEYDEYDNSYDSEVGREILESYTYKEPEKDGKQLSIVVSAAHFFAEHSELEHLTKYLSISIELDDASVKLTQKSIGAVINLIDELCKDYVYIIFNFYNENQKTLIKDFVNKIVKRINLYQTKFNYWDEDELKKHFEYMAPYKDYFLLFENGKSFDSEKKLEKKLGDLF
jgi:hypothetical protein